MALGGRDTHIADTSEHRIQYISSMGFLDCFAQFRMLYTPPLKNSKAHIYSP